MSGLKNVRQRRRDALSRIGWDRLEALLATFYRDHGYTVDHCGTGATGREFDGGIDLKLRRDDLYVLVQCKHWNAKQVPQNDVHQLLGLMVNEGATGAILVTSGEFTPAARRAAAKLGHVQLIDGERLREMIGPLPESKPTALDRLGLSTPVVHEVGRRLLSATEDRIRYEGRRAVNVSIRSFVTFVLVKTVAAGLLLLLVWFLLQSLLAVITRPAAVSAPAAPPISSTRPQMAAPGPPIDRTATPATQGARATACREQIDAPSGTYIDHCTGRHHAPEHSAAQLQELQRRADEAAKVLEHSTPEM